jgi:protein phosphatase
MTIAFEFGAVSDAGPIRPRNEDSAYCSSRLLAVADGVAGGPAGDVASALVIDAMRSIDFAADDKEDPRQLLVNHVVQAGQRLAEACDHEPELVGMATTLTAVLVGRSGDRFGHRGAEVGLAHVGDSRLYLLMAGQLYPMTRDHSLPQLLLEQGHISPAEAERHPQRSTIVRSVSADHDVKADAILLGVFEGQRLLLCSDGLTDYVPLARIRDVLGLGAAQDAANSLLDEALAHGSRDNVTVIVADVVDREDPPPSPMTLGAAAKQTVG